MALPGVITLLMRGYNSTYNLVGAHLYKWVTGDISPYLYTLNIQSYILRRYLNPKNIPIKHRSPQEVFAWMSRGPTESRWINPTSCFVGSTIWSIGPSEGARHLPGSCVVGGTQQRRRFLKQQNPTRRRSCVAVVSLDPFLSLLVFLRYNVYRCLVLTVLGPY